MATMNVQLSLVQIFGSTNGYYYCILLLCRFTDLLEKTPDKSIYKSSGQ